MPANGFSSDVPPDVDGAMRRSAALFLGQVLGLDDAPGHLAADLSPIKRDANAAVYTIQLDSSVGPAAFLVYAYLLDETGGDGHTGRELFDTGLATLQQAGQRSSPGPRAVAHAEADRFGFILATTPGTFRALTGGGQDPEATAADLPRVGDVEEIRDSAASDLLATLRRANRQASEWLVAVDRWIDTGGDHARIEDLEFTAAETELALYLLDDESIRDLLQVLHSLVSIAQQRAAATVQGDPSDD